MAQEKREKKLNEEEFVGSIDLDALKRDLGMDFEEIGRMLGLKSWRNIYKWTKPKELFGSRPSYNTFVKLFQAGARVETLFGVPYRTEQVVVTEKAHMTDQEILEGMMRAVSAMKDLASQKGR